MKKETVSTKQWISIRIKPHEYATIYKYFTETTCTKLSKYIRLVLLKKPVTILYKDESSHAILTALNSISRELSAIGNNFNQTVHKLHTLQEVPDIKMWAIITESSRQILLKKIEEIRIALNQIGQSCAHK